MTTGQNMKWHHKNETCKGQQHSAPSSPTNTHEHIQSVRHQPYFTIISHKNFDTVYQKNHYNMDSGFSYLVTNRLTGKAYVIPPTKGCRSSSLVDGRSSFFLLKQSSIKSAADFDTFRDTSPIGGFSVAILKMAATPSNSCQGGLPVSISTTVQPRLLQWQTEQPWLVHTVRIHSRQTDRPT